MLRWSTRVVRKEVQLRSGIGWWSVPILGGCHAILSLSCFGPATVAAPDVLLLAQVPPHSVFLVIVLHLTVVLCSHQFVHECSDASDHPL